MEQLNSTVVTSIISSSPGHPPPSSQDFSTLVPVVVYSLSSILGIPGNIAVIILRPNWQQMSSLSQSLMLNLAVADLLNLITLPLWIHAFLHGWSFGLLACKLIAYLIYCCIHCCLLTVMALSLQRYLQVVHGKKWFQHRGQKRLLALLWLAAIILSIPVLVDRQIISVRNLPQCESVYSSLTKQVSSQLAESAERPGAEREMGTSLIINTLQEFMRQQQRGEVKYFSYPGVNQIVGEPTIKWKSAKNAVEGRLAAADFGPDTDVEIKQT
ncbi:leukotriene B4 receptor 1-like isoform X2 [Xyrichtys novacula]|uniref:Leukotriene B4 receptor 1-like isoform X2 n=1 Tax=Xyrichtys novacula TaxID=13765 RepID=A0AAV1GXJ5_XYRNO|nr:leukotriene B4 receptor 1-like isoform X2 [Xyrichtys novacula]